MKHFRPGGVLLNIDGEKPSADLDPLMLPDDILLTTLPAARGAESFLRVKARANGSSLIHTDMTTLQLSTLATALDIANECDGGIMTTTEKEVFLGRVQNLAIGENLHVKTDYRLREDITATVTRRHETLWEILTPDLPKHESTHAYEALGFVNASLRRQLLTAMKEIADRHVDDLDDELEEMNAPFAEGEDGIDAASKLANDDGAMNDEELANAMAKCARNARREVDELESCMNAAGLDHQSATLALYDALDAMDKLIAKTKTA